MTISTGKAAKILVDSSIEQMRIAPQSRIAIMGSNYRIFKAVKEKADCPRCADSLELAEPKETDIFTFTLALEVRKQLAGRGIASKIILMPADFMKGADSDCLKALREAYTLPQVFAERLDSYMVPPEDRIFFLESALKRRAQKVLSRTMKDGRIRICLEECDDKTTIRGMLPELAPFMVTLGSMIEDGRGNRIPIPHCQVVCSTFFDKMSKMGFAGLFMMMGVEETSCVNQAVALSSALGSLRMPVNMSFFSGGPEKAQPGSGRIWLPES